VDSVRRPKVLIVDDQEVNVLLLNKALSDICDTLTALSGYDALTLLKEHMPDLILLDVMMPEMSGLDVCRLIKADDTLAAIPVIFITATDTAAGQSEGLKAGAIDYITKPFAIDLVKLRVKNHLELKFRSDLLKEQRDQLARQTAELEQALSRIKVLEGIIPICMYCKKIRNDANFWEALEIYLTQHTDAHFSHGICPECQKVQFPQIDFS